MIYLDSSVALAHIFSEERRPSADFWQDTFVTSRLLQFEVWNRVHARRANAYRHGKARRILERVTYLEMRGDVLERALHPFTERVRTLDALHLATMAFLRKKQPTITLASYDARLLEAAQAMGFETVEP